MAEDHCPAALTQAKAIEEKFQKIFTLFSECHALYDGNSISDSEIDKLGKMTILCYLTRTLKSIFFITSRKKIVEFMKFYREKLPWATVLPKMHMLEEHVVPWLRRWHVGFGLMGEQGAESIHAYFNSLKRTFQGIPDRVKRLKQMMHEHLIHIAPSNIAAKPAIKKRKKSLEEVP